MSETWKGKTRGGIFGYMFFIYMIRCLGITAAYGFLALVVLYFIPFAPKATGNTWSYARNRLTSTKSQTGHEMWMAGASEVIYSILMMNNGFIAPNLNFEEPDEASALLNIPSRRIETEFDTFLSNSFGFGGTNSSLIIRKFKENN